ncbi:protein DOWNY MILDEW RESISTANCE 6-like [Abrus precatorius]|uniref:Protein DOWNY MILDEW RESISTANCE 6-like n=1 Tax=Abrus precatorius TaxID=3816 RepID=A0A8B8MHD3_ABRPR|nr:protein DOWNY MILDEW RESISTANCE 6-like [Abrus precatorius]
MEKLLSNRFNDGSIPEDYIFPPESRPGNIKIPFSSNIPIIDLNEAQSNRTNTIQKIIKASEEFGFFQVINHGISMNLMNETRSVIKELFQLPAEEKQKLCSDDPSKQCRMLTSSANYATEKVHQWRDSFRHPCHPLEQWQHLWPENPTRYRECIGACSVEVKKLASRILSLISEGLGLKCGYFENDLSGSMGLGINYYPACPEPSLTLGIIKHSDPNLITILMQDDVCGLQVFKDAKWIAVEPLPHAFVVNIGYQLQIMSNGKLRSAEHRAVTNSRDARTSVAFFVSPTEESMIEPAEALTDEHHPPLFKSFKYKDFHAYYFQKHGDTEVVLKSFEAQRN